MQAGLNNSLYRSKGKDEGRGREEGTLTDEAKHRRGKKMQG